MRLTQLVEKWIILQDPHLFLRIAQKEVENWQNTKILDVEWVGSFQ